MEGNPFQAIDKVKNTLLGSDEPQLKRYRDWRAKVIEGKKTLLANLSVNLENESYDQTRLRVSLERFWAVSDFRAEAHEKLERIQSSMEEITAHKKERGDRFIKMGMAGVGLGLLAKTILEPIKDKFTMNLYEWQIQMYKKGTDIAELEKIANEVSAWETYTLFIFISCAIIGGVVYHLWDRKITGGSD